MDRTSPQLSPATVPTPEEMLAWLEQGGDDAQAALSSMLRQIEQARAHPGHAALLGAAQRALAIGTRLEQHRQNELNLRGVFESAQALTELKELDQVLFDIVERGRRLLGSDLAWLAGVDPQDGNLCVLAVSGVYSHETKDINTSVNAGVAGHVLRTRSPFATSDYMAEAKFEHTPETDRMIHREGLQSLVAAPLLSGAEVTGILIVGDRYRRTYHPREVSLLATLAAHAAVAVRNARAFDMTRQALAEAERVNQRLQQQTAALELAADAHEQMTRLLARGAPLKDLIATVAHTLDGRVMYLDAAGIEVCVATPPHYQSQEVMGAYQSFSGIAAGIQSAVGQSRVSGRATAAQGTGACCQVAAVMSRDELFGALVIQTSSPMTEQAIRIFERSATATAVLQLSAEKSSASLDQDIRLTLRALLAPGQFQERDLTARLARHGVDAARPLMLAMIDIDKTKLGYAARKLSSRLRQLPHLVSDIDGQVVMVLNEDDSHRLEDLLHALLFEELSLPGVACVSGPHATLEALGQAHAHTRRAVGLMHALRRSNCVVHEAALRMYAVLFSHHQAEELDAIIDAVAGRLIEHDARRNTQLVETLHAYLDNLQNARVTAGVLQIHVNTLHNRLEAIRALLGPWDDAGRVAELHLALRLRHLKQTQPLRPRR